jgi:hypothetical protein
MNNVVDIKPNTFRKAIAEATMSYAKLFKQYNGRSPEPVDEQVIIANLTHALKHATPDIINSDKRKA